MSEVAQTLQVLKRQGENMKSGLESLTPLLNNPNTIMLFNGHVDELTGIVNNLHDIYSQIAPEAFK